MFCFDELDELWGNDVDVDFPLATRLWNLSSSELFHLAVCSVVPVALGIL
jgi:hypothetical protein